MAMPFTHDDADRQTTRLLTVQDVADRLQVRAGWVYAMVEAGRLAHLKIGRYVRFEGGRSRTTCRRNDAPARRAGPWTVASGGAGRR